jgi:hypothetical protein
MRLALSQLIGRNLRQDEPAEVGISTLRQAYEAMERGDLNEAKRVAEYARLEWQVVHDMYVNWSWSFFTYIAKTYGEAELEKAMRGVLGSYYKSRYDKVMASEVKTQLQLTIEGLRGHLMGPGRSGTCSNCCRAGRAVSRESAWKAARSHGRSSSAIRSGRTGGRGGRTRSVTTAPTAPWSTRSWPSRTTATRCG